MMFRVVVRYTGRWRSLGSEEVGCFWSPTKAIRRQGEVFRLLAPAGETDPPTVSIERHGLFGWPSRVDRVVRS